MNKKFLIPILLLVVFAASRWPGLMPPNFSAAYAIAFCAGLYLPGALGWAIPLGVMIGTDLLISAHFYPEFLSWGNFFKYQAQNYVAYAGLIWMGRSVGPKRPWWLLLTGGIVGAMLFYLITNTASWMILPYAKTLGGWIEALTKGFNGYPQTWEFFRNTLSSGGLFTGLFVGAMKLSEAEETEDEEAEEKEGKKAPVEDGEHEPAQAES